MTYPDDSTGRRADDRAPRKGERMERVGVTDLYEAAFLVGCGARFVGVEAVPMGGTLGCSLYFEDNEDTSYLRGCFERREAMVNLYTFRQAYNTVNGYVHQAKKSFDRERRFTRKGGAL